MQSLMSLLQRPRAATLACVLVLLVVPLTLFIPVTLGGRTLLPADNLFQYQPFRAAAAQLGTGTPQNALLDDLILENFQWKTHILRSLAEHELPLWNPYLFAGVPFLAAGQNSALYPLSLLYDILPLQNAYGYFTVVQLGLAGIFMFVLLRVLGLKHLSALFGGVAYQLSGFMLVSVVFPMIIAAASWIPLILAMCERVIQQSPALNNRPASMPWVVIGALSIAMMILAGHVEIIVYTALVAIFFCIWRLLTVIGFGNLRVDGRFLLTRVFWLGIMGASGVMLAAIQLLPLLELVTRNFRGAGHSTFEQVLSYGFPVRYIFMWLMPNIFGNPAHHSYFDLFTLSMQPMPLRLGGATYSGNTWWGVKDNVEGGVYVGLITLILAGMSVATAMQALAQRQRQASRQTFPTWFFITLSIASVLFIFGTKFYAILYYGLPGISQLHSPFRWKIPLTVSLAALAAYGLDGLLADARAGRARLSNMRLPSTPAQFARATRIAPVVTIAMGAVAILGVIAARLAWGRLAPSFARAIQTDLVQRGFATPESFFSYSAGNVLLFGGLLIASGLVWWGLIERRRTAGSQAAAGPLVRFAPILSIALVVIDMNIGYTGFNPSVDPTLLNYTPPAIQFLQRQAGQWRFTAYEPSGSAAFKPMNMNMGWRYGLQDIRGYDSIIPKQYTDYMAAIEPQGDLLYNRIGPIKDPQSLDSPLLDLLGVKYVVAEAITPINKAGFNKVFDDGSTVIYENTRALPRAYTMPFSSTLAQIPQSEATYSAWFAATIQRVDPRKQVLTDAAGLCALTNCPKPADAQFTPANITIYKNTDVWVDAQVNGPSWLILNDSYFPGWRAFVRPLGASDADEKEVPITRVNGNFRGIALGVGAGGVADSTTPLPRALTVRFRYLPDSFRLGAFGTFLALVSVLFLGGIYVWRNWPRPAPNASQTSGVRTIARNSVVLTGLNLAARVIDFAFALLMLRVLGPTGAGVYYFAVVIVGWFEILMNFGLNTYLTREISRDKARAQAYLAQTSRLRLTLALVIAPVLIALVLVWRTVGDLTPEAEIAIALLAVSQIPSSLATGLSALFFAFERTEVPAALTIVSALLKATIGAALLLAGLGVAGLGINSIAVNIITLVIFIIAAQRMFNLRFAIFTPAVPVGLASASQLQPTDPGRAGDVGQRVAHGRGVTLLRESFPLMLNHLLATLFFKVDVPLLEAMKGSTTVGWYSAAYKFIDAFNIVPAYFTQSLFPAMSRMAAQRDESLARSYTLALKLLVILSLPLTVVTAFLAPLMVGILGGDKFLPHGAIALAIMGWSMPVGWMNSVTNYALIAAGKQQALTRAFIIGLVFNIIANLVFIPQFSYVAAAVVTILSEIMEGAAFYVYVHRHITPVNWFDVLARPTLAAGVMAAITYALAPTGALLVGLTLGILAYVGVLWVTQTLAPSERALLRPLLHRNA